MQTLSHIKLIFASILLIALLVVSDGQFFTKTGSKSIPRMGRRADNSLWSLIPQHPAYKRKVIEAILEEYNEKNNLAPDASITSSPPTHVDNEGDVKIKSGNNGKTASLQVEDDSDDQFNTSREMRKLQRILKSYFQKSENGL